MGQEVQYEDEDDYCRLCKQKLRYREKAIKFFTLRAKGEDFTYIARKLDISRQTLYRWIQRRPEFSPEAFGEYFKTEQK